MARPSSDSTRPNVLFSEKNRLEVTLKQIVRHPARNDAVAALDESEVAIQLVRREFVADVQKLAEVRIEILALGLMPHGRGELRARPLRHGGWVGQLRAVNVNDGGIGAAQFVQ